MDIQEAKAINFMSYISNHNKKNKQGHIVVTSTKISNRKRSCQIICKDGENSESSHLDSDNIKWYNCFRKQPGAPEVLSAEITEIILLGIRQER